MSTFEVSSVGFDNKRLTSALKKRHRYHFGGQRFKQRFTGILCLPPQQLKNLCIQSLTGDCVTLGCSTAMVSLDPFSAQLKRKSQSQSQRESGPRPPFFLSFFCCHFPCFFFSLFLFVVRTTRNEISFTERSLSFHPFHGSIHALSNRMKLNLDSFTL